MEMSNHGCGDCGSRSFGRCAICRRLWCRIGQLQVGIIIVGTSMYQTSKRQLQHGSHFVGFISISMTSRVAEMSWQNTMPLRLLQLLQCNS
jgi:hypothetical protein